MLLCLLVPASAVQSVTEAVHDGHSGRHARHHQTASVEVSTGAFVNLTAREAWHKHAPVLLAASKGDLQRETAATSQVRVQGGQPVLDRPQQPVVRLSAEVQPKLQVLTPNSSLSLDESDSTLSQPLPSSDNSVNQGSRGAQERVESDTGEERGGKQVGRAAQERVAEVTTVQASCSIGESIGVCMTPLVTLSLCANVVMCVALVLSCCCVVTEHKRALERKAAEKPHTTFEVIKHNAADEALLQKLEKLVSTSLMVNVRKSPSKSSKNWLKGMKDRYLVPCPMVDVTANGSAASRIAEWRGGFLGWWTTKVEYTEWCNGGKPSPKGSLPLADITEVALQSDSEFSVVLKYASEGVDLEMDVTFTEHTEAAQWIEALQQFQKLLKARKESSGRPLRAARVSSKKGPLGKVRAVGLLAKTTRRGASASSAAAPVPDETADAAAQSSDGEI